jgi:hypothetical protein
VVLKVLKKQWSMYFAPLLVMIKNGISNGENVLLHVTARESRFSYPGIKIGSLWVLIDVYESMQLSSSLDSFLSTIRQIPRMPN